MGNPNNKLFWTLTGKDFSDAIREAQTQKNLVREAIKEQLANKKPLAVKS